MAKLTSSQIPQDPHFEREAQKYQNPIPSREFILALLNQAGVPLNFEEIAEKLGIQGLEQEEALDRRLRAMVRDAQLARNRGGRFGLLDKMRLVAGRVHAHKEGFGFLIPEDGGEDLYLSAFEMRKVFHGDKVLAREGFSDRKGRTEGKIVEVLERNTQEIAGRYVEESGVAFVIPENRLITQDILVQSGGLPVHPGQLVVIKITEPPSIHQHAMGRVTEILGDHMGPGMEIEMALRSHQLPYLFSEAVLKEIETWTETVPESAYQDRKDLRALSFVTIDGEDARDFDDAVYAEKTKGGFTLWVAIADVAYYVRPNTALDESAYERGTSVYFPSRVIPMLPEILSNGLCSLKPKVDRLAMVCEMHISNAGIIKNFDIYDAVICSKARLTYDQVFEFLFKKSSNIEEILKEPLLTLFDLYERLLSQRKKRGAIDFETIETQIIFDENKKISKIIPRIRNEAHKLIEECMLAANQTVAQFLTDKGFPSLFRVHEKPLPDKLNDLRQFLKPLGLKLKGGDDPEPKDYAKLIDEIRNRVDQHLLQMVLLRSMSQAVYLPDNKGHFGLAFDTYTHFTSPIRRYPDLLVHRALKAILKNTEAEKLWSTSQLTQMGEHCSMTERRADDASRSVTLWLKCEFMLEHVGEVFDGLISGVTHFGLFVELSDIYIEGLVHISGLANDYYQYDAIHHRLIGERTGVQFRMGDKIKISVAAVHLDERKIDLMLHNPSEHKK